MSSSALDPTPLSVTINKTRREAPTSNSNSATSSYYLGPALGVIADLDGGGMVDATVYADLNIGSIVVTPMGGIGADWQGNRSDEPLGGTFQFRLSLEAAYQFGDRSRIGLRAGHISSGGNQPRTIPAKTI